MTFNKLYLNDVVECQGELFQFGVVNGFDLIEFAKMFMKSSIKKLMDRGNPRLLTMFGIELYDEMGLKSKTRDLPYELRADWFGQFLCLLQFRTRIDSDKLEKVFDFKHILDTYNVLHDLDLEVAVKRVVDSKGVDYYA